MKLIVIQLWYDPFVTKVLKSKALFRLGALALGPCGEALRRTLFRLQGAMVSSFVNLAPAILFNVLQGG